MSMYFADDSEQLSFGVQASNVSEVAQFSSTLDNVNIRMFTNNGVETPDNLTTGVAIGSSNYDKSGTASNNLYIGHIVNKSNITPVLLMQDSKIAINTVPYSNYSLTVQGGMSIDNISTPWLVASNVNDTFFNISASKYVNSAAVSVGTISPAGSVPFTTIFNGNSTLYSYYISATSNGVSPFKSSLLTSATNTAYYTNTFTTGTYNVHIDVTTPGTGTGSRFIGSNLATFTVGPTDSVVSPTLTLANPPTFATTNTTSVSGVQYYSTGTVVTFGVSPSSLGFTNMYGSIDPRTIAGLNPLTINGTNYTYNTVFTNVTSASSANNSALTTTLTSSANGLINLSSVVRNINYQSGVSYSSFVSGICYLGTPVDETTMAMASYTGLPISGITRMSISASQTTTVETPSIVNLSNFASPSVHDAFFSPLSGTSGRFFPSLSSIPRGSYAPTLPADDGGSHAYVTLKIVTTAALSTFVLNLANSNGANIDDVRVYWVALGAWYSAKVFYTSGGCASSTWSSGATRFPITVPQGQSVTSAGTIYINIKSTGYLDLAGMSLSYT